jgi:hypothetical protein
MLDSLLICVLVLLSAFAPSATALRSARRSCSCRRLRECFSVGFSVGGPDGRNVGSARHGMTLWSGRQKWRRDLSEADLWDSRPCWTRMGAWSGQRGGYGCGEQA